MIDGKMRGENKKQHNARQKMERNKEIQGFIERGDDRRIKTINSIRKMKRKKILL